ncbi:heterogeneous nuclear rnp K-like protein 2 [Trichomonascus vanleenenianus]|uniref:heterogeneous nuclear rnp K-like protein 2 n=1 Tax=Trichomonascus vanleenenianus TaxID=2268995 RepID=UPI003ECB8B43
MTTTTTENQPHPEEATFDAPIPRVPDSELASTAFLLRALVTTKEAGAIIGKSGKNVAELREQTGVKAGVSSPVPGAQERIMTVSGTLEGVTKAYGMVAQALVDSPPSGHYVHALSPPPPAGSTTVRLLVAHQQMGTVIGRQGSKIKSIQETCKVRMVASKEPLPQSTERIVEVQGTPDAIRSALWEIARCLLEDWDRATGSIPYNPANRVGTSGGGGAPSAAVAHHNVLATTGAAPEAGEEVERQISIPSDLVGCIIGKGGTKIQNIRRTSGSRISIAKESADESERLFTLRGSAQANEKALKMIHEAMDVEKSRRLQQQQQQQQKDEEELDGDEESDQQ